MMQSVTLKLETLNKALAYLGSRPYVEVGSFLGELVVEANATLVDKKDSEDVSEDEDKKEDKQDD